MGIPGAGPKNLRGLFAALLQQRQDLQGGKLAVPGSGVLAENHVPRLFAAQGVALLQHPLQHVAVPHVGTLQIQLLLLGVPPQALVGHHRTHNGVA